jgi:hypothetical protein
MTRLWSILVVNRHSQPVQAHVLPGRRNWVRTSDPSLVSRTFTVAGRRLVSSDATIYLHECRCTSSCVARHLPVLAPS